MKHLFMLSISSKLHLIKHLGTGCTFRDTRRALKHLRHLDVGTWGLVGYSEGTRKALGHFGSRRSLGHSNN